MNFNRVFAAVVVAGASIALLPAAAHAAPTTSGPGAARIVQQFTISKDGRPLIYTLRAGNSGFGEAHIAKGGSTDNKENHELTQYAKDRWVDAFKEGPKANPFPNGYLYTNKYSTPGGRDRTMCVVVDGNDYTFAGTNYGNKGIITGFWAEGHGGKEKCSKG